MAFTDPLVLVFFAAARHFGIFSFRLDAWVALGLLVVTRDRPRSGDDGEDGQDCDPPQAVLPPGLAPAFQSLCTGHPRRLPRSTTTRSSWRMSPHALACSGCVLLFLTGSLDYFALVFIPLTWGLKRAWTWPGLHTPTRQRRTATVLTEGAPQRYVGGVNTSPADNLIIRIPA